MAHDDPVHTPLSDAVRLLARREKKQSSAQQRGARPALADVSNARFHILEDDTLKESVEIS